MGSSNPIIQDFISLIIQDSINRAYLFGGINSFLTPAIIVLCLVGGIKIGWSFLKRSFK